jgi:hypothetical protein
MYMFTRSVNSLIICCFTSRSRIYHLYGDVTIAGEGLQNLDLCSALRAFEESLSFHTYCDTCMASVFLVLSEKPPYSVAFNDKQRDAEDIFGILTGPRSVKKVD